MREFEGGSIRYWHDPGHARARENMGVNSQRDLLEAYSGDTVGTHRHNVTGLDSHLAPGQGEMDYYEIRPFPEHSNVEILEPNLKVKRDELVEGIRPPKKGPPGATRNQS